NARAVCRVATAPGRLPGAVRDHLPEAGAERLRLAGNDAGTMPEAAAPAVIRHRQQAVAPFPDLQRKRLVLCVAGHVLHGLPAEAARRGPRAVLPAGLRPPSLPASE